MRALFLAIMLIFVGCADKNVFTPKKVSVIDLNATYTDKKLIDYSKDSLTFGEFKIQKGVYCNKESIVAYYDENGKKLKDGFVKVDKNLAKNGDKLLDLTSNRVYKLPYLIYTAKQNGDLVAFVLEDNSYGLFDLNSSSIKFYKSDDKVLTSKYLGAKPLFFKDLVLFPLLNGNLAVVSLSNFQFIKNIFVSDNNLNNNIIFLKVIGDNLYIATSTNLRFFNSQFFVDYPKDIRHIIFYKGFFYLFTIDGEVIKLSPDLKEVAKIKLKFAKLSYPSICNGYIYTVEREGGYIIKIDPKSLNYEVLEGKKSKIDTDLIFKIYNCKIYNSKRIFTIE